MARILVLDDDAVFRKTLSKALAARGHDVTPVESGAEAGRLASLKVFDAAIIDMMMPGMNGFEALGAIRLAQPGTACVILTGYGSIADAVKTMRLGGYNYLTKPCSIDEIEAVLAGIKDSSPECPGAEGYQGMLGVSAAMKEAITFIRRVKDTSLPVLVSGESGTGKELAAAALHFDGPRANEPFVAVNCATLKPGLLENELFGHVKGAFTGAADFKEGLLKAADKGTLFIDEIGDMDLSVQASLLRFLETGSFRPLGSTKEVKVGVRVVAAINRDIEEEVRAKRFRLDLYYRLNVCRVHLPPLRSRVEDIPVLAAHFLKRLSKNEGRQYLFGPGAVEALSRHDWPGNVRELLHTIERAAILGEGDVVTAGRVGACIGASTGAKAGKDTQAGSLGQAEKECILSALGAHGWNVSAAARALKIDRRTLQRKIAGYCLRKA
jgi:DNA-binding NtrC family response regulator